MEGTGTLMPHGKLVVLSGPSAVGKGTIAKHIVSSFPNFFLSVSATTREPRPGEIDGESYVFVSAEKFRSMAESGELLEWASVHGSNLYGTPRQPVLDALAKGHNVLLEIDVQGAFQVRESFSEAILIFVSPPAFEDLEARMSTRGTESAMDRATRLETARVEINEASRFDFEVINDQVARCAQEVVDLVQSTKNQGSL
jgi:guanylate kinase